MKTITIPSEGRGNPRVAQDGVSVDRMIYEFMEEHHIPGMTLAIVQAPYIPRVVGYGVADAETGRLASSKTLWPAAQISQAFTAVAVMQLMEQGLLTLDDPAGKWLKALPEAWRKATVLQLLQHAAGIPDYRAAKGFDPARTWQPKELIGLVAEEPLTFEPGTDVRQSATGFLLLAEIVEKASGKPYRTFVREGQIEPVGLKHTMFREDFPPPGNEPITPEAPRHTLFTKEGNARFINPGEPAVGTRLTPEGLIAATPLHSETYKGFADVWASAEDISTWDIALAGGILIHRPENRARIYGPTTLANGWVVPAMAGWQFQHHKGLMDIKGTVPGYSSFLSRFTAPDELVCVTLMANREGVDLSNLARRIAAAFGKGLGTGVNDAELYAQESVFSADETVARLEATLRRRGIPVFAKYDHAAAAATAGLKLAPTTVLVFGSPAVGTRLMQEKPSVALELPLRIAVWEDASGSVWVAAPQMRAVAERYALEDSPVPGGMQTLLEALVGEAANLY